MKDPVNPAAVQAARAFAIVWPTTSGTVRHDGVGRGVGAGVGFGVRIGVGRGVAGAFAGRGVAAPPVRASGVEAGRRVDVTVRGVGAAVGVPLAVGSVKEGAAGVPVGSAVDVSATATAPVAPALGELVGKRTLSLAGRNGSPTMTANATNTSATTPIPAGSRGDVHGRIPSGCEPVAPSGPPEGVTAIAPATPTAVGSGVVAVATDGAEPGELSSGGTGPGPTPIAPAVAPPAAATPAPTPTAPTAAPANTAPHSGHASPASDQHQRQAKMSHSGQWHIPTHGPMSATSTDAPQRSQ
jgi:hypothetical protein